MLADENVLLEGGVDIYAQPPGKKLQNISLCSGGEKALAAVALLFFVAKPSPNRHTMEISDILGVAMEEYGISKVISVKMNKQNDAVVQ
jgi:chromosome segregation protein